MSTTISGTTITSGIIFGTTESSGVVTSPLTIASDGAVEVSSGSAIYGDNSQAWAVYNYGTVAGGPSGAGVDLGADGTIVNGLATALIAGGAGAVGSDPGGAGGAGAAAVSLSGGGGIVNTGTIAGGQGGLGGLGAPTGGAGGAGGRGVSLSGGGSVVNTGTILGGQGGGGGGLPSLFGGKGGNGGIGIYVAGDGGIANTGTIAGGQGGAGGSATGGFNIGGAGGHGGVGILLLGGGGIGNTGTILAGQGGTGGDGYVSGNAGFGNVGIALSAGGSVNNGSLGATSALISGRFGIQALGTAGATVINYGTIASTDGTSGIAVSFAGSGSNLLALGYGYRVIGGVVGSTAVGSSDTLELLGTVGVGVTADFYGLNFTNFEDVLFSAGGYATLRVSRTTGTLGVTISGFDRPSEVIDLTGIGNDGTISNFDTVNNLLTVSGSGGTVTFQLDGSDATGFTTEDDLSGGTDLIPVCYCRGTMILTPVGEVAVEDLAIGDLVMTLSGAARPVKWIGHRGYDGRFVAGNRAVLPIRITAGALADGVPARDLLVSPDHSLYLDGVLVTARQLLNGATITQETAVEQLEYFHVELDAHDIIFADGAPAESYADCDNRGKFHNAAEFAALYPAGDHPRWQFCAPLLQWESEGPNPIRAALMQRAEALGHRLDLDPDLHLVVDGAEVWPDSIDGPVYRFTIPAGSRTVALASRSAVPAEIRATARDLRRLGVPIERLVLYDADLMIEAAHGHAALRDGFHDDEPSHRWTDGLARLPETWLRTFPGEFTLELHLISAELPYRLPPPTQTRAVA